jgi:signal transduction histidine kinase
LVDLSALIEKVVEDLRETTTGYSIEVTDEPDLVASIDSDRIQQVLENLLGNAAKYGEPGAPIQVEAARKGEMIEVTVTNRGAGIPAAQLPDLFNRFARTKEARASRESGLGLGLYISKGLVEAHGGHLWAESVPGETTTFHFTIPLTTGPEAEQSVNQGQTGVATHC